MRASALFILAALAIVFAVMNLDEVEVHWMLGSGKAPLIVVIVISLLVGSVLTYFAERLKRSRRKVVAPGARSSVTISMAASAPMNGASTT